jgi:hypothetical protein
MESAPVTIRQGYDDGDVEYVRKDSIKKAAHAGPESIVRTYSAGVHIGEVVSVEGTSVVLKNARRLWKWAGALTLNEVSSLGINRTESKISRHVESICLLQAIEIIPVVEGIDLTTTEK